MNDAVYVFEFKLDGTVEEALAQIAERGYAPPLRGGKPQGYENRCGVR
jgi:hypothetical protein